MGSVIDITSSGITETDLREIIEEGIRRALFVEPACTEDGELYVNLVNSGSVPKFTFRRVTGILYATNEQGSHLASGVNVRDILLALD